MGDVSVRLAGSADQSGWNKFMASRGNPPLNRFEWASIHQEVYGARTWNLVATTGDGTLVGAVPVYAVRSFRGTHRVYSTRYGLQAESVDVAEALLDWVFELVPRQRVSDLLLTSGYERHDLWLPTVEKTTLIMPVAEDADAMWEELRGKTRNMIRRARRGGVGTSRGFGHLDEVYDIYVRHMTALGVPFHDREFFHAIREVFADDAELVVATLDGQVIGGTLVLVGQDVAIYPFQTVLYDHIDLAPNQAMVWEAMRLAGERGAQELDMGESRAGGSTYRFKHNFGGEDRPIYYYRPSDVATGAESTELPDEHHSGAPAKVDAAVAVRLHLRQWGDAVAERLPAGLKARYLRFLNHHGRLI